MGTVVTIAQGGAVSVIPDPTTAVHAAIAMAQLALAIIEVDRYADEHKKATRQLEKGLKLQEEVSDWYHNFYIEGAAVRAQEAVTYALSLEAAVPDPAKLYRSATALVSGMLTCNVDLPDALLGASCFDAMNECDRRHDIEANKALTSVAHNAHIRAQQDRVGLIERKMQSIRAAIGRAEQESTAIYSELNNHLRVYQSLADISAGGFNGALGNAGAALGMLARKYSK